MFHLLNHSWLTAVTLTFSVLHFCSQTRGIGWSSMSRPECPSLLSADGSAHTWSPGVRAERRPHSASWQLADSRGRPAVTADASFSLSPSFLLRFPVKSDRAIVLRLSPSNIWSKEEFLQMFYCRKKIPSEEDLNSVDGPKNTSISHHMNEYTFGPFIEMWQQLYEHSVVLTLNTMPETNPLINTRLKVCPLPPRMGKSTVKRF